MLTIPLTFEPHGGYHNDFVELDGQSHQVSVSLQDGTHTALSNTVDVGTLPGFEHRRLLAQLSFTYTYDEPAHTVTICGTDLASADAMTLITAPDETTEYCRSRTTSAGFSADDVTANPHWNYRTPLTPGLDTVLTAMARGANDALITGLEQVPGLIVRVRTDPPELSAEEYRQFITVSRQGANLGAIEPGQQFESGDTVNTIESVWGGVVTFNLNEAFANVIGSTNDPKIGGLTWVSLWANQFGLYPNQCTSRGITGFKCGMPIFGGHVITGKVAQVVPKGSNSVYIMPICQQHNNDDNVYMEAIQYLNGIWLKNYLGP